VGFHKVRGARSERPRLGAYEEVPPMRRAFALARRLLAAPIHSPSTRDYLLPQTASLNLRTAPLTGAADAASP
jgi:hypothetical protein